MVRFAQWLALALVIALVVTEGLPWLNKRLGSDDSKPGAPIDAPSAGADVENCLSAAGRATDRVGDRMRSLGPTPPDEERLREALTAIEDDVFEAENACGCPQTACRRAEEALAQLRALVHDLSAGNPWGNPANRLEQAYRFLEEARAAVR